MLRHAVIGESQAEGEGPEGAGRRGGVRQGLLERVGGVLAVELAELRGGRADEAQPDGRVFIMSRVVVVVDAVPRRQDLIDVLDQRVTEAGTRRLPGQGHAPARATAGHITRGEVVGTTAAHRDRDGLTFVEGEHPGLPGVQRDRRPAPDHEVDPAREVGADRLGDRVAGAICAPDADREALPFAVNPEARDGEADVEGVPERDDRLREEGRRVAHGGGGEDVLDAGDQRVAMDALIITVEIPAAGHVHGLRRQHRGDPAERRIGIRHVLAVMQAIVDEVGPTADGRKGGQAHVAPEVRAAIRGEAGPGPSE